MNRTLSRRAALGIGAVDVFTAALVLFAVFVALPARWWPVDGVSAVLAAVEVAAGIGLVIGAGWAVPVARAAAALALCVGLFAVSMLAVTASWLSGVYGPVGRGGGIVLALAAALALPYLVGLPIAQLLWLGMGAKGRRASLEPPS
jgi:hypothetical protein